MILYHRKINRVLLNGMKTIVEYVTGWIKQKDISKSKDYRKEAINNGSRYLFLQV